MRYLSQHDIPNVIVRQPPMVQLERPPESCQKFPEIAVPSCGSVTSKTCRVRIWHPRSLPKPLVGCFCVQGGFIHSRIPAAVLQQVFHHARNAGSRFTPLDEKRDLWRRFLPMVKVGCDNFQPCRTDSSAVDSTIESRHGGANGHITLGAFLIREKHTLTRPLFKGQAEKDQGRVRHARTNQLPRSFFGPCYLICSHGT